jgi:3-(3-hydroxy-phenyl)propionate hydroxylase
MIHRIGLLDRFMAEGLVAPEFQFWDRPAHSLVATFDHGILKDDTPFPFVVQTEQHKLARMGVEQLRALGAEVRFSTPLTSVSQTADTVTAVFETANGAETLQADWLIGADGGRSTVRKQLNIDFEGYTWPERFLVLTVLDDYHEFMGCCLRNYLIDPGEWANLFKVAGDDGLGRWRAVFPAHPDESDEMAVSDETAQARLRRNYPLTRDYQIVHRNLYRVHQRVAAKFRAGRILLAGDAGHVNNPIGGLGLNFGVHDAIDAIDSLKAVAIDGADDAALDGYERRRRTLNIEFVQQQTIANKNRLEEKDPVARQAAMDALRRVADSPEESRKYLLRSSLIDSVRQAAAMG